MTRLFVLTAAMCLSAAFAQAEPTGVIYKGKNPIVTIVEFGDFQCPYCKAATKTLDQVAATYGDKVEIVFRNLPLSFHTNAHPAAVAGVCADAQGHFAEMYQYLYANQDKLGHDVYLAGAKNFQMDVNAFETCLSSSEASATVDRDIATSEALSVIGTPTFFLSAGGKTERLNGSDPFSDFKRVIDELMK